MTGYHAQGKGNSEALTVNLFVLVCVCVCCVELSFMLSMGTLANTFTVLFCLVMSFQLCLYFAFMFNHCLLCVVGLIHR